MPSPTSLAPFASPAPVVVQATERPRLADGYRTPDHGVRRLDALAAGLLPAWRLVASTDSPERLRQGGRGYQGRGAFTAHLLTTAPFTAPSARDGAPCDDEAARWAVAVLWDGDWYTGERHMVLEQALTGAVVEDTMAALVRRFATGNGLPSSAPERGPVAVWPPTSRWTVLAMLLEQPFPGRAVEQMLVDLTFGVGAVTTHRAKVLTEVAHTSALAAVALRFDSLVEQARRVGLHRQAWVTYRAGISLREVAVEHWDTETLTFGPGFAAAEQAVWKSFFGDVLDDLTLPGPLTRRTGHLGQLPAWLDTPYAVE